MMIHLRLILLFILLNLFGGCSSDQDSYRSTSNDTHKPCSVIRQNQFVLNLMKDTYLWYQYVPEVEPAVYESPQALIEAIRYEPFDQWSHVSSKAKADNFYLEGRYLGLGFGLKFDQAGNCRLKFVYAGSPAERAGLVRGNKLLAIDGVPVSTIQQENLWDSILGKDEPGIRVPLKIRFADNREIIMELEKEWIKIQPVLDYRIIKDSGRIIGYLAYNSFLDTAQDALQSVLTKLKLQQIQDLILDLRYNSGGTGSAAQYLASMITGGKVRSSDLFMMFSHNDRYRWRDKLTYFLELPQALSLERLLVIATDETCSASEVMINCLTPYMPVIVIGETTCGKPVGMYQYDYCDIQVVPIEFFVTNAIGQGDYFDGIPADCRAQDDLNHAWGSEHESLLGAALEYLRLGYCKTSHHIGKETTSPTLKIETRGLRQIINAF